MYYWLWTAKKMLSIHQLLLFMRRWGQVMRLSAFWLFWLPHIVPCIACQIISDLTHLIHCWAWNWLTLSWNGGGGDTWKLKTRRCGPLCLSSWFYNSSVWRAFVSGGACIENKQHIGWLMRLLCVCDWWHKQPSLWPVFLLFNLNALIQGRMTQG